MGCAAQEKFESTPDFFGKAERKFAELTEDLKDRKTQAMEFSELEKRIEKEGRELLRLMLEAHINSRGNGDIGPQVEGADSFIRTHRRIGDRQIKSRVYQESSG